MKDMNEQLSATVDNELLIEEHLISELLTSQEKQEQFSRYHLIGDVMRGEVTDQFIDIDISQQVMAKIKQQGNIDSVVVLEKSSDKIARQTENNVISFAKRFGQYAIAASVAGVVVLTSLMTSEPAVDNNTGLEVLKTVPLGGATPVSLQATQKQLLQDAKEHNERLEALLNDHQLQLQTQP
ncbi:sigma-E factor negative regulatory protein [Psychromonas sp.]|uniref:sigma-E factor negative regulatory protein n=1 Tax=Psychromonas sp. TaxID=1884585 RepID=UPI00356209C7